MALVDCGYALLLIQPVIRVAHLSGPSVATLLSASRAQNSSGPHRGNVLYVGPASLPRNGCFGSSRRRFVESGERICVSRDYCSSPSLLSPLLSHLAVVTYYLHYCLSVLTDNPSLGSLLVRSSHSLVLCSVSLRDLPKLAAHESQPPNPHEQTGRRWPRRSRTSNPIPPIICSPLFLSQPNTNRIPPHPTRPIPFSPLPLRHRTPR